MYEDFRDGTNLLLLLEVLTDEKLVQNITIFRNEKSSVVFSWIVEIFVAQRKRKHALSQASELPNSYQISSRKRGIYNVNSVVVSKPVNLVTEFCELFQVKVVNIHENEIVDGNSKIILGLIWIIILHFQVLAMLSMNVPTWSSNS